MMTLLDQATNIAKETELRKTEIEKLRDIPKDLITKIKSAGLVKMWATKECGGSEMPVSEVSKIISSMAAHNASLAWVTAVTNCSSLFTGFVSEELAQLLFGQPDAMVGGFAGPAGKAIGQEDDSLLINGLWSWGSGIKHCSHIVGGVFVHKEDQVVGSAVAFFEPEDIKLIDNWHVVGLKGTHSIDYQTNNCIIPKSRWSRFPVTQARKETALYQFSFLGALSVSLASVAMGLATRAVEELGKMAQSKQPFGQGKPLAKRSNFQEHFGKLVAKEQATRVYLDQSIKQLEHQIIHGGYDVQSKANIRLAAAYSTELASAIVQDCYRLAGGSAIWQSGKLEELMRDSQVVTQHGMVNQGNYRTGGAVSLGQDVPTFVL